jgi:hypothetical protein
VLLAPTTVLDAATEANVTSFNNLGFNPAVSVTNTLATIAEDVVAVVWALKKVMKSTLEPNVPPVKTGTKVPLPSLAVFAALIVALVVSGVKIKIGIVFAGIILSFNKDYNN